MPRGTVISLRTFGRLLFSRGSDRPGRSPATAHALCSCADTAIASLTPTHAQEILPQHERYKGLLRFVAERGPEPNQLVQRGICGERFTYAARLLFSQGNSATVRPLTAERTRSEIDDGNLLCFAGHNLA